MIQDKIDCFKQTVHAEICKYFNKSKEDLVRTFLPLVMNSPEAKLKCQLDNLISQNEKENLVKRYILGKLDIAFGDPNTYIEKSFEFSVSYMDLTLETIMDADFIAAVKKSDLGYILPAVALPPTNKVKNEPQTSLLAN